MVCRVSQQMLKPNSVNNVMANVYIAYALWLLGGYLGLHQLYLGRVNHAVFLSWTFGGFFGFGLLRDLFRIPAYVRYANGDVTDIEGELAKQRLVQHAEMPQPPWSVARVLAEWTFATLLGMICSSLVNVDDLLGPIGALAVSSILYIPGSAFGVWFIGCIGEQQGSFPSTMRGAVIGKVLDLVLSQGGVNSFTVLGSIIMFQRSRMYRIGLNPDVRASAMQRIIKYGAYSGTILILFTVAMYSHGKLVTSDGKVYYFSESFNTLRKSDFWESFNSSEFYTHFREGEGYEYFTESVDIKGVRSSLRIFGFHPRSVPDISEVKTRYRQLAKKYHPDGYSQSNEQEKEHATRMFIEVKEAYDILIKELKDMDSDAKEESKRKYKRRERRRAGRNKDEL